ncbi:S-layer homology domain-containing protein [Cohnella faecalis]|uniref:S-layer homology domain-containing protein n=1 Tax=Cohnella faecalis TaxID=2315694 RepID=UPI0011C222C2|nr:S-layer homology domain-containing protein [Cohnella faecalis]
MKKGWFWVVVITFCLSVVQQAPVIAKAPEAVATFSDVSGKHWAKTQIDQAVRKGYVKGYADGTFKPDKSVTVAEFLAMLFLSFTETDSAGNVTWSQATLDRFPDHVRARMIDGYGYDFSQGKPWYKNYADYAKFFGLMKDEYEGRYNEPLTRERASRIVIRMDEEFHTAIVEEYADLGIPLMKDYKYIEDYLRNDAAKTLISGILSGYPDGTWKPKKAVSRAEAISVIERFNDETLRKPVRVNLTGVPYSVVPGYGYADPQIIIFANNEMKQVHDTLTNALSNYKGVTERFNDRLVYFENEERLNGYVQQVYYNNDSWNGNSPLDVLITATGNAYGLVIPKAQGRYERAAQPLDLLLGIVYKDKASEARKVIDGAMISFRAGKLSGFEKLIGKRSMRIDPSSSEAIIISIGGYADR